MKNKHSYISRGFTLIELIVVIAIFSIITTLALFNQGKLNGSILVTNLAYEIALSVREAQTYGVGVRADNISSGNFEGGYGISFDMSRPERIILFTDTIDANRRYDDPGEEASALTVQNQRGNKIVALCRGGSGPCIDGSDNSVDRLDILFKRPNPEAMFFSQAGGTPSGEDAGGPAYIVVNTPAMDNCRVVVVEKTGQIRVDTASSGLCANENE